MEALTLTRKDYKEGLENIDQASANGTYLEQFKITFPDGINTANSLEICRVMTAPTMENKVHLMRLCIAGKNVEVECPNGDIEKFCITNFDDSVEGFPLFMREPLALLAIADCLYGYILKKYVRPSKKAQEPAAQA